MHPSANVVLFDMVSFEGTEHIGSMGSPHDYILQHVFFWLAAYLVCKSRLPVFAFVLGRIARQSVCEKGRRMLHSFASWQPVLLRDS